MNISEREPLLTVDSLTLEYRSQRGSTEIVRDVSFSLKRGEILGVIGESGAGKTSIGNAIIGLLEKGFRQANGAIDFASRRSPDIEGQIDKAKVAGRISAIFQDHTASLDPLMRIGKQVEETVRAAHRNNTREFARQRAHDLLRRVGIPDPERRYRHYPHQFSGGQRQRIVIAIALASFPDIIVADEPTSALDATVQKQILGLLRRLVDETGVAVILVTHDMGVVSEIADRVLVMRHGQMIEQGPTATVLEQPEADYTRSLLAAVPRLQIHSPAVAAQLGTKCSRIPTGEEALLATRSLSKSYSSSGLLWRRRPHESQFELSGIDLQVRRGEIIGLVGQSGSGKSTIGRIMAGLDRATGGSVLVDGKGYDVTSSSGQRGLLGKVQMIFQDPAASLNPRLTIAQTLGEAVHYGLGARPSDPGRIAAQMIDRLGLPTGLLSRYPHQLSGGQKQRACIGRALLARPKAIVADEPTSALDVSVQAEIIKLLKTIVDEEQVAMVFISHDLAVVQSLCSTVHILNSGRIVDSGPADRIFSRSDNAYTRALLDARPARFTH